MIDHVCTNFFYKRNVYDDLETNVQFLFNIPKELHVDKETIDFQYKIYLVPVS